MTIRYDLDLEFEIDSVWFHQQPVIEVSLDGYTLFQGPVDQKKIIHYNGELDAGIHSLTLCYQGKTDMDTDLALGLDTAIKLERLAFFGIDDMKFIWSGKYRPEYPAEWRSQQTQKLPDVLVNQTYLGWNGVWTLEFEMPIFTWIHKTQNLGWIY